VKRLEFVRKDSLDGELGTDYDEDDALDGVPAPTIQLIILDEVSMVDQALAADLLSFGVRVLVLGDPAQLPPINGTGFFTQASPNFMLTEVHRQAAESPVLRLATEVREGGWRWNGSARPSMAELAAAGQVLCWRNATRWSVVRTLRGALGRPAGVPVAGDRVMCLANNRQLGVFNGQQFWVAGVQEGPTRFGTWRLTLVDDEPRVYQLEVMGAGFVDQKGEEEVRRNGSRGTWAAMTFANAITVHKAQGSEWDSVIVIDESAGLERMTSKRGEDGAAARRTWLYTAITRASREVVLADARGW
jgi:exodeoxyribonuclease-5